MSTGMASQRYLLFVLVIALSHAEQTAYNFQANNWGKGGSANDVVLVSVQDSSGSDNANFATPAE